jgi:hypothetical protein
MHKSRLGTVIIDCETENLTQEAEFWSAALGSPVSRLDEEGRYIALQPDSNNPHVLLQKVEHPSRIHIDIETDDIAAEVKRLEGLGASVVETMKRWTVMEAPSKHHFCIISSRREGFESEANVWD